MRRPALLLAVAWLLLPSCAGAEIKKCVGSGGDIQFVNTKCPKGYTLESTMPSVESSSSQKAEDPYICRFDSILTGSEIDGALVEADLALKQARDKGDGEAERSSALCLGDLQRRQAELRASPEEPGEDGPAACSEGEFEYREGAVYFTNGRRRACRGVRRSAPSTFARPIVLSAKEAAEVPVVAAMTITSLSQGRKCWNSPSKAKSASSAPNG